MNALKKLINYLFILFVSSTSLICKNEIQKTPNITIFKKIKEENITIFIHGTHTRPLAKLFHKFIELPNDLTKISDLGDSIFYKSLMKSLIKSSPQEFPIDSFYIFGWSGELSHNAREEAAKTLYNSIKKITLNKKLKYKITIVSHSHGGNVALNLANVCKNSELEIDKLILLGTPVQQETKDFVKSNIFKKIYNIYSGIDTFQLLDLQKLHPENKNKNVPLFSQRRFDPSPNLKQTKIKINNRGLFHIEFILDTFLSILPQLIKEIDKLDSNKLNYLIKVNLKNKSFETLESGKKMKQVDSQDSFKQNENITIFVHGSHTSTRLFIKYVDEINKLINASQLNEKHHTYLIAKSLCKNILEFNSFYAFGWSGKLGSKVRLETADILYKEIKQFIEKTKPICPKITLITHSHGGNVALNLARIIDENNPAFTIDKLILLACPVQEETKHFVKSTIFKNIYHIYSTMDTLQILDPQGLHKINKNKKVPFFSQRRFDPWPNLKQGKIKINNRALFHIEFILENFLQVLPDILNELDKKNIQYKDAIKIDTRQKINKI